MTVKELKMMLSDVPDDTIIVVYDEEHANFYPVESIVIEDTVRIYS